MFTGIIREIGVVERLRYTAGGATLAIRSVRVRQDLQLGDSVAVDGACFTVTELGSDYFSVDVVQESLARTIVRDYQPGRRVNLESALRLGEPLGGHLVLGHVDGIGRVLEVVPAGTGQLLTVEPPTPLQRYIAEKGSIAVNGVSLTVASLAERGFTVALVPFTLRETNLGELRVGDRVNLEIDVIARYVERLMNAEKGAITWEKLRALGFVQDDASL